MSASEREDLGDELKLDEHEEAGDAEQGEFTFLSPRAL